MLCAVPTLIPDCEHAHRFLSLDVDNRTRRIKTSPSPFYPSLRRQSNFNPYSGSTSLDRYGFFFHPTKHRIPKYLSPKEVATSKVKAQEASSTLPPKSTIRTPLAADLAYLSLIIYSFFTRDYRCPISSRLTSKRHGKSAPLTYLWLVYLMRD